MCVGLCVLKSTHTVIHTDHTGVCVPYSLKNYTPKFIIRILVAYFHDPMGSLHTPQLERTLEGTGAPSNHRAWCGSPIPGADWDEQKVS